MAVVRSVEQTYWALAAQYARLEARESAVNLAAQILKREQSKLEAGGTAIPNVAEAQENLERFRLELAGATADLAKTDRQLRNLLGLPTSDKRQIAPVTVPTAAPVEIDWDSSLAQMLKCQPDIVQNQLLLRAAEMRAVLARGLAPARLAIVTPSPEWPAGAETIRAVLWIASPTVGAESTPPGKSPTQAASGDRRAADLDLVRQRACYDQVLHQATHSLARFCLEVDANYKQYKTAGRLKTAAFQRLEAQKAFYESGSITIDRYLDAVHRWANSVLQEADFLYCYNTAIAAVEEAKGTLLDRDRIVIVDIRDKPNRMRPTPESAPAGTRDPLAGKAIYTTPAQAANGGAPTDNVFSLRIPFGSWGSMEIHATSKCVPSREQTSTR
jgi:hypothetical protein